MLSRHALKASRTLPRTSVRALSTTPQLHARTDINVLDPGLNGGYPNPPAIKRQFRDPFGEYWDQQERRNYGEPIHEDNDVLGVFTTEKYTWTTPGKGVVMWAAFIGAVLALGKTVGVLYPDRPAVDREFSLETELGGKEALIPPKNTGTNKNSTDL